MSRSRPTVELIPLIADDGDPQDVGPSGPSGPRRPRWLWALGLGVAAIVVVGGVMAGGSDPTPSATATSIGRPSTVQPDATAPSSRSGPGAVHLLTTAGGPARPFGLDTGLAVYLAPAGGAPDRLLVYAIDSGRFTEVDLGRDVGWFVRAVGSPGGVFVDGGDVLRITATEVNAIDSGTTGNFSYFDAPYGRLAPGPGNATWLRTLSPPGLVLLDGVGKPTGARYDLPIGAVLYGSMADGRPVVRGADQRSLVIQSDGRHVPLATGPTSIVEHGRFVATTCDEALRCSYIAHVEAKVHMLGPVTTGTDTTVAYRFQPDGPLIAIVRDRELSILDVDSAELRANLLYGIVENGFGDSGLGDNGPLTSSVAFLPGGAGLVAVTSSGVQFLDLSGQVLATVNLPPGENGPAGPLLLGIGPAGGLTGR